MLRRDPTTIKLVAEDIKDISRDPNLGIIPSDVNVLGKFGFATLNNIDDNQNWDTSIDESYLGSRSRERDEREAQTHQGTSKAGTDGTLAINTLDPSGNPSSNPATKDESVRTNQG